MLLDPFFTFSIAILASALYGSPVLILPHSPSSSSFPVDMSDPATTLPTYCHLRN